MIDVISIVVHTLVNLLHLDFLIGPLIDILKKKFMEKVKEFHIHTCQK